jgi:hypothetical protein
MVNRSPMVDWSTLGENAAMAGEESPKEYSDRDEEPQPVWEEIGF